jgi:hypothetical protein
MWARILLAGCVAMFAGCASRNAVRLEYTPVTQTMPKLAAKTFNVSVDDQRTYEWRQRQPPSYLGTVRGAGAAVTNVFNEDDRSLAEQVGKDLRRELRSLGLIESHASPVARISVRVLEWNIHAATPARYLYIAEISVADRKGNVLQSSMIRDEKELGGSVPEDLSEFYAGFIRKLVRENPVILAALERGS